MAPSTACLSEPTSSSSSRLTSPATLKPVHCTALSIYQSSIKVLSALWAGVFLSWLWGWDNPLTYNPLLSKKKKEGKHIRKEGFRAGSTALWTVCMYESVCVFCAREREREREKYIPPEFFFSPFTVERPLTFRSWDTGSVHWSQNKWLYFKAKNIILPYYNLCQVIPQNKAVNTSSQSNIQSPKVASGKNIYIQYIRTRF